MRNILIEIPVGLEQRASIFTKAIQREYNARCLYVGNKFLVFNVDTNWINNVFNRALSYDLQPLVSSSN